MRVAVVGGGINGFACAVQTLEYLKAEFPTGVEVNVISELFTPNTTGDGAAGLWCPYLLGNTSTKKIHKWSKGMHDFLEKIWLSGDAGEAGVCLIPSVRLTTRDTPIDSFWDDIVYGCTPLTEEQLAEYNKRREKKFTSGFQFITYTSEPRKMLPYLMKRFHAHGGRLQQQKIDDMEKFINDSDYDAIINCTGLGSRELFKDQQMFAVRGQVSRVRANWLYCVLLDESDHGNYIIPNTETVVLGATHQVSDYNTNVSIDDKQAIVKGCRDIIPALENAQHVFDWVGLRPGREELRLELEKRGNKIVIHNYGHGGSGVTLSWGCGQNVVQLLSEELLKRNLIKSKL